MWLQSSQVITLVRSGCCCYMQTCHVGSHLWDVVSPVTCSHTRHIRSLMSHVVSYRTIMTPKFEDGWRRRIRKKMSCWPAALMALPQLKTVNPAEKVSSISTMQSSSFLLDFVCWVSLKLFSAFLGTVEVFVLDRFQVLCVATHIISLWHFYKGSSRPFSFVVMLLHFLHVTRKLADIRLSYL